MAPHASSQLPNLQWVLEKRREERVKRRTGQNILLSSVLVKLPITVFILSYPHNSTTIL